MPIATELTIDTAATALDMANAIFGPGITVVGATYSGDATSSGIYSGAAITIPGISASDRGVILSTGNVTNFTNSTGTTNTNTSGGTGTNTAGVDGDAQLNAVAGMATFDGAILQASFIPDGDYLTMQFVFSSEEYPEYVNGNVNDSFGVWVNGTFVPVTITIAGNVAIDEINPVKNRNFYHDNTADQFNTEMDGFTYTLSLKAPVNAGQVNTIKIGIADGGDAVYDSNLLIMGDSIQTVTLAFDDDANVVANGSRTFDILANDSNSNGTLTITQIQGTNVVAGQTITLASGQQVRLNADGTITVFATATIGTENFSYTVSDNGITDVGYVAINTSAAGALDGIVSGTTGDDFIDAFYTGDIDGDRVDNNDATGVQGTIGNGDVIQAGDGNDYVLAGLGNDIVEAGNGNDTVDGGAGNDRAELGAGNDSYQTADPLAAGNDTVYAEGGNDAVLTGDGNDLIFGGSGNDNLQGGAGNDALYGGDDADRILANAGDVVIGGEGGNDNDTLAASNVASLLYGGGNNESGTLTFADGSNLTFSQIEKLELNGGNPDGIIFGTAGNDIIGAGYVDANGDVTDNNDSILTAPQGTNSDEVYAGEGNDSVQSLLGDDFVYGGVGDDSIDGGADNDYMQGDAGNDTVLGGAGNDFIRGDAGNDSVYGGSGDDSTYGGLGNDQVFGGDGNDQMFGGFGNDTVYGGVGNDTITGSGETDIVYGEDGDDSIQGSNGNDTLYGGAGNDTMLGEEDADSFYGGAGDYVDGYESVTTGTDNDTLYVDGPATIVWDTLNPENGTITFTTTGGTLPFYNIEHVFVDGVEVFSPNYVVDGTAAGEVIGSAYIDAQGDRIDNSDNLAGNNDDLVLAGGGNDTVYSDTGSDTVYGGSGDDIIRGETGADSLLGDDGADTIYGGGGSDSLYGGLGNDDLNAAPDATLLDGGGGDDELNGDQGSDTIFGGIGDDAVFAYEGNDLVDGGDGNDNIAGYEGNDTLAGGSGDDTLRGGSGSDRFLLADNFGFDTIIGNEDAGDTDIDVLDASANTEGSEISFSGDEAGTYTNLGSAGGAVFSGIEQLRLGSGRDSVDGGNASGGITVDLGAGNDVAYGGIGSDTIFAGTGEDIVQGGKGNDLIDLGAADGSRDLLNMVDGDGSDRVTGFEAPIDNGDGTFTGLDLLEVSSLTDAAGNPVNVRDVIVSNDGAGNAVLTFPNGEQITLVGIAPASVASQAALIAMGIPPAGDGIVSGTASGDLIDVGYAGDPDGDRIDANDALLPGAVGNDDLVQAGDGNDTVFAADGADAVFGEAGNDQLFGGAGNDTLTGGAGNDSAVGGANNDSLIGEAGADTLLGGDGDDVIDGGDGADLINAGPGNDTVYGGADADSIVVQSPIGTDSILGGETGADFDTIDMGGHAGAVSVTYTGAEAGNIIAAGSGTATFAQIENLVLTAGNDTVNASADTTGISVSDTGGNDAIRGGSGNDTVYSGSGSDTLAGGLGNDVLYGGTWDDVFVVEDSFGTDLVSGGSGYDIIDLSALTGLVNVTLTGNGAGTVTNAGNVITFSGIEQIVLTNQADVVDASASTDGGLYIQSLGGNDTVIGGSGNDIYDDQAGGPNGQGNDVFYGGAGNDTLWMGTDDDTAYGGTGNDVLQGQEGNDQLLGGAGDDFVNGGSGSDTLSGGAGNDSIDVSSYDSVEDVVVLADGDGQDTVTAFEGPIDNGDGTFTGQDQLDVSDLTDTSGTPVNVNDVIVTDDGAGNAVLTFPNGEAVTLIGIAPLALGTPAALIAIGIPAAPDLVVDGTAGNDLMTPGYVDLQGDIIDGADGDNDTIFGYAGNDSVQAGAGDDLAYGGIGNDEISGDAGNDTLEGGAGNDQLFGGMDDDSLIGGDGDDFIDGGTGQDILYAGDGNDGLNGGARNDLIYGGAGTDAVDGGEGDDTIYGGSETDDVRGSLGDDQIYGGDGNDRVLGGDGNDTLFGDAGLDTLEGSIGDDLIDGGDGNDLVNGGSGNDTLLGDLGNDTLQGLEGNDLLVGGDGDDSLFGWQNDDTLTGGAGDDMVDGDDGDDQVDGGAGNDTLIGDAGNDTLNAGDANDQIYAGAGNDAAVGGAGDDQVFAGEGNDTLTGDAGNDSLFGGDDRDTFIAGSGDIVDGGEGGDDNDVLDLSAYTHAGTNVIYTVGDRESGTVEFLDSEGAVTGTMVFSNIENVVACFTLGCLIQTDHGEVAVEDLHIGDNVLTRDHGFQPIRWVGRRDLSQSELAYEQRFNPISIEKDALGHNLPHRTMMVSPQHRMLITGPRAELLFGDTEVLVAATHMVGMAGVQRVFPRGISYVHILFDQHQIVQANGAWSESFQPGTQTLSGLDDAQRDEVLALFPHLNEGQSYPSARLKLKASEARVLLQP